MRTTLKSLKDINLGDCVGYYWLSDSSAPKLVENSTELERFETETVPTNPFIVEANLFCKATDTSVSISHNDGKYLINRFDLSTLSSEQTVEKSYIAQKDLPEKFVFMTELWMPENDTNCADMEVLTKKATVFTGFETREKK